MGRSLVDYNYLVKKGMIEELCVIFPKDLSNIINDYVGEGIDLEAAWDLLQAKDYQQDESNIKMRMEIDSCQSDCRELTRTIQELNKQVRNLRNDFFANRQFTLRR